jgi:hypothetical protein
VLAKTEELEQELLDGAAVGTNSTRGRSRRVKPST